MTSVSRGPYSRHAQCHVLVYEGGRRGRVATGQQQLRAPRGCGPAPCRPTGLAELTELLEPLFGLVEAAAPHECPQHRVPAQGGLDRKPEGQALLEPLTGDGQATIDLSGRHVPRGKPAGGRRPRGPTMPAVRATRYGPLLPRECLADVAEVRHGRGIPTQRPSSSASTQPALLAASMARCAASRLSAKWSCRYRYCDWAIRARASSSRRGVAGVLDRPPDRLLPSDRRLGHTRYAERGVDARGEQPVGVGSEHLYRRAGPGRTRAPRHPAR